MKKLTLLILLVLVASTLVAAIPTKTVRLTVINKSGYDVMLKLEGSAVTGAFYYLTIPSGDTDNPVIKVFTIMVDLYTRTTWQCGGVENTGTFWVPSNTRLTFTPCGRKASACDYGYVWKFHRHNCPFGIVTWNNGCGHISDWDCMEDLLPRHNG